LVEQTARADGDSANAGAISTLSAQVNHASTGLPATRAALLVEQTVRADADSANAGAISTLSAQVNHATTGLPATRAALLVEQTVRADGDSANAGAISTLSAQVNHATTGLPATRAALVTEQTARADGDSANASAISTLSTTVGGHTSTIAVHQGSIDGLSAQYTVKIDTNGKVAGFGLASTPINGTPVAHFAVVADKFSVSLPGETGNRFLFAAGTDPVTGLPTVVINGALYAGTIAANQVRAGTLNAGVAYVGDVYATQLKSGSIATAQLFMEDGSNAGVVIDGLSRNILVRTAVNANRVAAGKVGSQHGLWVWDATAKAIFAASELGVEVVGTANIVPGSVTNSGQTAAVSGSLSVGDNTIATQGIEHKGKKVRVEVAGAGGVVTMDTNASTLDGRISVRLYRDDTEIAYFGDLVRRSGVDNLDDTGYAGGSLACTVIDRPPASPATSTYTLKLNRNGGHSVTYAGVRLTVTALYTEA
ncbi:DUF1983 domain-containing protein, partial [Niveispirillum sp.]|uniref:phage tail tip fiber protein n=1 Tax=Niveispirillum sp. TaxID=1917217 RepID=UPI001B56F22E